MVNDQNFHICLKNPFLSFPRKRESSRLKHMKEIYKKLWRLAKPYYKKGRPTDIDHIEWMMKNAILVCKQENIDDSLLLPLVILHDIGYSEISKRNSFDLDVRKAHMKAGAEIARKILIKIKYQKDKIEKIVYYVSVHDNWALGNLDIYKNDKILGIFNDLDFAWIVTPKGFTSLMKILGKNHKEMIDYLESEEVPTKVVLFSSVIIKQLYRKLLMDRKKELQDEY